MRSHVAKSVSSCFVVLSQLRSISRSVSRSVLQSLMVSSLVLPRLDYGNAALAGIPSHLLSRLQSVMNAAARLIFSCSRYDNITPLLRQLHWLKASERIAFKCAVLVYKCLYGSAPSYLVDVSKCRGSSATPFCLVFITDRRPHYPPSGTEPFRLPLLAS